MEETIKSNESGTGANEAEKNAGQKASAAAASAAKKGNAVINFFKRNPVLLTALVGIIAVAAVYFWKDRQGTNQKAAIEKMATAQLNEKNQTMLKLLAKPLVWSIRAEMLRGNMEQVNIYTTDLVKENNFQFIYMIDPTGKIIVSTDKKLEGQSATGMFEAALLRTDSAIVVNKNEGMLTLAAPVMGFDKQLAVIVLNYAAPAFTGVASNGAAGIEKNKE